ncbi:hypothetical protein GCM10023156_16850 [Novipirellula rosea]|uniref:Uncharacterized protein n=1 Tax=Novipirellula rosea TaxID=1031540 RepID=A0ABP8MKM7_9BACT
MPSASTPEPAPHPSIAKGSARPLPKLRFRQRCRSRIVKKNDESLDDFRYGWDDFDANDNHLVCNKLNDPSRIPFTAGFVCDLQLDGVLSRF